MIYSTNFLIVGAGIIGLTIAKELIEQGFDNITIIEKEPFLGMHASGRNSGVLHAGIYYSPQTLKAKLCFKGNQLMQQYCLDNNLPLKKTGKVIVAKEEKELTTLLELYERAQQNGAKVSLIDELELAKLEPNAKTINYALYSHETAVVDSKKILLHLYQTLIKSNKITILTHVQFEKLIDSNIILTDQGTIKFQTLINAAGSYADKIAHEFGLAEDYFFLPFKGIYKQLIPDQTHLINGNIYSVPNLKNPFLGIHFTKDIHGNVYIGPTAIPALGRENYDFLDGLTSEIVTIVGNEFKLFFTNNQFRIIALTEAKKYISSYFFKDAKCLVKKLEPDWLLASNKVGIRPQLINRKTNELLMDFFVVKNDNSLHILNAISPAFTSSLAFSEYIVKQYI